MKQTLYLAWRYLAFHRLKTFILLTSITLILYLPVGLRVLVNQSSQQLTRRADATPLVVGSKGSPLELVLNTLYFRSDFPEPMRYSEAQKVRDSGLARIVPMYVRYHSRGHPIVGTSVDYFDRRELAVQTGRLFTFVGECVLGARVAEALGVHVGDAVISSPENLFDLAGEYPLKMTIVGILAQADSPDDDAIFVDIKTTWIIEGIGHGHQDVADGEAAGAVLSRDGNRVVANASIVKYNEITEDNLDEFHFHGDLSDYPITAVVAFPPDQKSSALLQGRYENADERAQIARPSEVMAELLDTILTIESFVLAGAVIVGIATLASASLVFMLSLRLRRREMETLFKIGGSRANVGALMASEMVFVLVTGIVLAAGLTFLTSQFGAALVRALIRM
ncbi:MAG: ABC transporter permease [Acidobacteria bacterium]|nr:MAG: ABC transporter permease [Acidobacteriota bacterium]